AATTVTTPVPTVRAKGIVFHEQKQSHIPTVSSSKDKGKGKMIEPKVPIEKKDHMKMDEKLQAREREEFSKVKKERLLVELIEKRKKRFAALRAQEKRNKSPIKAQMRGQMEIKKVNDFIDMDSEAQKSSGKEAQESSSKRIAKSLEYDIFQKQKVDENVEPVINDTEELKKCMEIVLDDGDKVLIEATLISSRTLTIIDYKIHKEGKKNYFKIIRADDKFKKEKPVDDMDNLMFRTLKTMFEHHVEDTIWTYQQGLVKVKN
nr:hypothetical protein [Tanacetum cinerariifolium]